MVHSMNLSGIKHVNINKINGKCKTSIYIYNIYLYNLYKINRNVFNYAIFFHLIKCHYQGQCHYVILNI